MENIKSLKKKFAREIGRLPLNERREFLTFILSLLKNETIPDSHKAIKKLKPEEDPILSIIGAVNHGSLAKDIDEELYGNKG